MKSAEANVLALDAATDDVVVGIAHGGGVIHETRLPPGDDGRPRHSTALLGELERAVEAGGGWERVARIGIGIGPGSYTGLRIGIATGRALAQARGVATVPVGTLTVLARGIAERSGGRPCLALIDARRGEVFAQLHDGSAEPLSEPAVLAPSRLAEWLAEAGGSGVAIGGPRPLAGGSGAVRFMRELEVARVETLPAGDPAHRLAARHLCRLAASGATLPLDGIRPTYLRDPDARRWLDRDGDQTAGL